MLSTLRKEHDDAMNISINELYIDERKNRTRNLVTLCWLRSDLFPKKMTGKVVRVFLHTENSRNLTI